MKTLVIAEKKTTALIIAGFLSKKFSQELHNKGSHCEVGDYYIGWCLGHLYEDCRPSAYGYKFGDLTNMPIIVTGEWKNAIRDSDLYRRLEKNLSILANRSDRIIHFGDAAREGQKIVDEVLEGWKRNPFAPEIDRLWLKGISPSVCESSWNAIKPNAEYRFVHDEAEARSHVDWMWGMTFTGMFTRFALIAEPRCASRISVGRVRTPVQAIIAQREKDMRNFTPKTHYKPLVEFKSDALSVMGRWKLPEASLNEDGLLLDKSVVDEMLQRVKALGKGTVRSFVSQPKKTAQPLTYNLTTLTQAAAKKYDFTSDKTLQIAQKLYDGYGDKPFLTYPRTNCPYMSKEYLSTVPLRLDNLKGLHGFEDIVEGADHSIISPSWIDENDPRIEDHDSLTITPEATAERINDLPMDERKIVLLVVERFLEQFYPAYEYKASKAEIDVGEDSFHVTGNVETSAGWKAVRRKVGISSEETEEDDEDEKAILPELNKGDVLDVGEEKYGETLTRKPKPYTEADLMGIMMKPAPFVKEPTLKRKMREGAELGTAATRNTLFKQLETLGYLHRPNKRKQTEIRITPFGESVVDNLPDELKSVGMTALWEDYLSEIGRGKLPKDDFINIVIDNLKSLSETLIGKHAKEGIQFKGLALKEPLPVFKGDGQTCPECHQGIMKSTYILAKPKEGEKERKRYSALACRNRENTSQRGCGKLIFIDEKYDATLEKIKTLPAQEPLIGDGFPCPQCKKGEMKTSYLVGKEYKIISGLKCSNAECGKPLFSYTAARVKGEGRECPKCHEGILMGYKAVSKEKKKPYEAMICVKDGFINKECGHREFPEKEAVAPLPGDGETCSQCGKGIMKTFERVSKKTGKPFKALFCTIDNKAGCKNIIFEQRPEKTVTPLPGDGETCSQCGKGIMKTFERVSKKTGNPYTALFCTQSGKRGCGNLVFPESKKT